MTSVYIIQQDPRMNRPNHSEAQADELPWFSSLTNVESLVHLNISSKSFIFTSSSSYLESEHLREALSRRFRIPDWFWSKGYQRSNGSFGCEYSYLNGTEDRICQLWSRYLVKQLEQNAHLSHHKYVWYEMGFFALQAASGHTAVLCFNTPDCFRLRLLESLRSNPPRLNEPAIYQLQAYLTDQVLTLYDESVWAFRDIVRDLERHRSPVEPDFPTLHDIARHGIHVSESLDVAIETMSCMIQQYMSSPENRSSQSTQEEIFNIQILQHLRFQLQILKSLRARSISNQARMQNEITLAFNLVTQRDSRIAIRLSEAVRSDSTAMKTVALLTLIFLPATFVAAIFSTSFFNFSPADEFVTSSWPVSHHFWIYWAFSAPLTVATIGSWYVWQKWYLSR